MPSRRPHIAARLEDAFHAFRERRARRRGLVPIVVPFTGYGGPGWVRVLGRVVMRRPGPTPDRLAGIRGWRSFVSVPVRDAEVVVESGGVRHVIHADRGGVIDQRLEIDLEPGWRELRVSTDGDAVAAPVLVVDPGEGFGIVSDVDDTVMVTALPGRCSRRGTPSCSTSTRAHRSPAWPCSTTGCTMRIREPRSSTSPPVPGTSHRR
ncbi:hypothetical protein GCM10025881_33750 [Pseudolysinimonas kribbensis]|uniref:Uncharacterized protein n=1 Tax=Pseudolysinimonas kribbensis TaxID=433641 RepID=A0ABQ6K7B7_9MICO|nr:hypothetical protein GCM10025881_33750 [Pseudolysinimonas kribbensis]